MATPRGWQANARRSEVNMMIVSASPAAGKMARRSLAQYQTAVRAAVFDIPGGLRPPEPVTDAEVNWLATTFPDWARQMGVGQHVPLSREWRSRFVATLRADQNFRRAVAAWLRGAE